MKKIFYFILGLSLASFGVASCDLDINKDPYDVTTLNLSQLLTAAEYEVGINFAEGYYLNSNFSSYVHQTVSREIDNYSLIASYSTLGNTWNQSYRYAIKNCDKLIEVGDETENAIYAGIGRIMRAYTYMNLVDLWGDVPYSEANKEGIEQPKCDPGAEIYKDLLKTLNAAIANLKDENAKNSFKPKDNDLFYRGDVTKWIKVANTLKLRLLVQSRLAKGEMEGWASELSALISENNFIGKGEDFQFPHTSAITPQDERKSGWVDEYKGTQKSVFISPWFHECLHGLAYNFKSNPMRGIEDPRVPYYFFNQITEEKDAANKTDYRDGAFVSIMFGSNSGLTSNTQEASMTVVGIYPVGGRFDDGKGAKVGADDGNGIAPDKMIQAYSVPFMKAELALAGEIGGDAKTFLKEGIEASIDHVNAVVKASDPKVELISAETTTTFVDEVLAKYDAADNDKKLEIVMTQKWIANFYNPIESYNDIRRTGYPTLFKGDENNMAWTPYAQEVSPAMSLTSYPLSSLLDYPRIMWYPQNEIDANPNISNSGRVVSKKTVFWDK